MKLCPLAFFYSIHKYDKDKMISEVALLSSMTHDTPISIICSCLFTLFAEKIFRFSLFTFRFVHLLENIIILTLLCFRHIKAVKTWQTNV